MRITLRLPGATQKPPAPAPLAPAKGSDLTLVPEGEEYEDWAPQQHEVRSYEVGHSQEREELAHTIARYRRPSKWAGIWVVVLLIAVGVSLALRPEIVSRQAFGTRITEVILGLATIGSIMVGSLAAVIFGRGWFRPLISILNWTLTWEGIKLYFLELSPRAVLLYFFFNNLLNIAYRSSIPSLTYFSDRPMRYLMSAVATFMVARAMDRHWRHHRVLWYTLLLGALVANLMQVAGLDPFHTTKPIMVVYEEWK